MAKVDEVDLSKLTITDLYAALQYLQMGPMKVWEGHATAPSHIEKQAELRTLKRRLEDELDDRLGIR